MVALVIGLTATLGFLALGLGGFVLNKPRPTRQGGRLVARPLSGCR